MSSKNLIILSSPFLFEILKEIEENLNFKIDHYKDQESYLKDFLELKNYLVISDKTNNIKNCKTLSTPNKIDKILEQINIWFLSNKFSNQSHIKIGNYFLNLNSRQIIKDNNKLNLTEKETELILFIVENEFVTLKELQREVWKHTSELETHTVETHIYRLRKKFLEKFKEDEFIKHDKRGYHLN
ncbi:transcriptional regulator [alpha proteobacterium HIMB5]|nr:transcriptional regulator [alpha proteobacterium HIMB5]